MHNDLTKLYGNRVRVRVCGLCWHNDALLMINHTGLSEHDFWSPPGGGIEFGHTAEESLIREFEEETSLTISPKRFLFACEFIKQPLHAIELFFEVEYVNGEIVKGIDPEMGDLPQLIKHVQWMEWEDVIALTTQERHGIFNLCNEPLTLMNLRGYIKI